MQELYRTFAARHPLPLHMQPAWLDAVCVEHGWSAAITTDRGGEVTGVLPYTRSRRFGLPVLVPPPCTAYNGPLLVYPDQPNYKATSRYAFQKQTIADLVAQLPRAAMTKFVLPPMHRENLAWHWLGYKENVQYTYLLPAAPIEQTRAAYKNTVRTNLLKAQERVTITESTDAAALILLIDKVFKRKGLGTAYSPQVVAGLFERLRQISQCTLLLAHDIGSGEPHSALLVAWDGTQMHGIFTGQDERYKSSCSLFLLYDHMIALAAQQGKTLDLEGSMQPGVEHFFRSFGAVQTPYSVMRKWW